MISRTPLILALTVGAFALASCNENPTAPPSTTPELSTAATTVPLTFYQVSGGDQLTCGVTTDNRAYCWGFGWVGDGSRDGTHLRPVAVAGGFHFRQISTGVQHTCAVTTDYRAYCWGDNTDGALGDGTTDGQGIPVPVTGGRRFSQVDAGLWFTCGVSYPDRLVYCWGRNTDGQLGNGTVTRRLTPTAVVGGRQFRQVTAGGSHTCGVTPSDVAYCWGWNQWGQAGDGSTFSQRLRPVLVAGGLKFRQVDAGSAFSCGVTTSYRAFCWGRGSDGQIGDGTTNLRRTPRAVAGGLSVDRVTAGAYHACVETTGNRAYCWGSNLYGALGDGTRSRRLTPVSVTGGLFFSQVSAGTFYTCARTAAGKAYCWGSNLEAELGDGTTGNYRLKPTPVAGPM